MPYRDQKAIKGNREEQQLKNHGDQLDSNLGFGLQWRDGKDSYEEDE